MSNFAKHLIPSAEILCLKPSHSKVFLLGLLMLSERSVDHCCSYIYWWRKWFHWNWSRWSAGWYILSILVHYCCRLCSIHFPRRYAEKGTPFETIPVSIMLNIKLFLTLLTILLSYTIVLKMHNLYYKHWRNQQTRLLFSATISFKLAELNSLNNVSIETIDYFKYLEL